MKLTETEHRIMALIWAQEGIPAGELSDKLRQQVGWSKTTTYTLLTRCMEKGLLRREDPKFRCYSLVSRQQVADWETDALLRSNFDDRPDLLIASLVGRRKLSPKQMAELYDMLRGMEAQEE